MADKPKTKTCNSCKKKATGLNEIKKQFGKLTKSKDGLNPTCKECMHKYQKKSYDQKKNKQVKNKTNSFSVNSINRAIDKEIKVIEDKMKSLNIRLKALRKAKSLLR